MAEPDMPNLVDRLESLGVACCDEAAIELRTLRAACRHARDFFAANARALRQVGSPRDRIKAEHYEAHQAVMEAALGAAGEGGGD